MGWVSNIEVFWEEPTLARFLTRLASFSRLILFDKRGTGLSDRVTDMTSLKVRMDDVRRCFAPWFCGKKPGVSPGGCFLSSTIYDGGSRADAALLAGVGRRPVAIGSCGLISVGRMVSSTASRMAAGSSHTR